MRFHVAILAPTLSVWLYSFHTYFNLVQPQTEFEPVIQYPLRGANSFNEVCFCLSFELACTSVEHFILSRRSSAYQSRSSQVSLSYSCKYWDSVES